MTSSSNVHYLAAPGVGAVLGHLSVPAGLVGAAVVAVCDSRARLDTVLRGR